MGKVLQEKINQLFEATKDLKSLDEIKPHCDRFNEWVNQQTYSEKSLGTLFSRYGLYSKFRSIPLEQGKNAELIPKLKENGSIKGHELKHYVTLLCGLDKSQWNDRNCIGTRRKLLYSIRLAERPIARFPRQMKLW